MVGELAKWFDESKFFGYFGPKLCTIIMDISEFGLQATPRPGHARTTFLHEVPRTNMVLALHSGEEKLYNGLQ